MPFQPAAKALFDERRANKSKDDPSARCLPTGLPVRATLATPLKFVQTPGLTVILYESRTTFRQILTDGRPLPERDRLAVMARLLHRQMGRRDISSSTPSASMAGHGSIRRVTPRANPST